MAIGATVKLRLDKREVDEGLKAVGGRAVQVNDRFLRMAEKIKIVGATLGPIFKHAARELGEFALKVGEKSTILAPILEGIQTLPDELATRMAAGFDRGFAGGEKALAGFTKTLLEETKTWAEAISQALGEQLKGESGPASEAVKGGLTEAAGAGGLELIKNQIKILLRAGLAPVAPAAVISPPESLEWKQPLGPALKALGDKIPALEKAITANTRALENPPEAATR